MKEMEFGVDNSHSYNRNVATCLKHVGKAVLLKEMYRNHKYWKTHEKGLHDGFYWFFIRMDKLKEIYTEFNEKSMYRWIKELEALHLIASRKDLNRHSYDKTRWFTVNVEAYEALARLDEKVLSDSQNENRGQFSNWAIAILKMRNGILKLGSRNSQNEPTIQSSVNTSIKTSVESARAKNEKEEACLETQPQNGTPPSCATPPSLEEQQPIWLKVANQLTDYYENDPIGKQTWQMMIELAMVREPPTPNQIALLWAMKNHTSSLMMNNWKDYAPKLLNWIKNYKPQSKEADQQGSRSRKIIDKSKYQEHARKLKQQIA